MKLRIARNADYYSSHLNFTRRLTDIAEKLSFTDVEKRSNLLQYELDLFNCSVMMDGDPLNRIVPVPSTSSGGSNDNNVESSICDFIRVVRIPSTEGHVFRSKERTPVLLLVEVIDESTYIVMDNYQKDKQHRNKDFSPKGVASSASSAVAVATADITSTTKNDESTIASSTDQNNSIDIAPEKSVTSTVHVDEVHDNDTSATTVHFDTSTANNMINEKSKISTESISLRSSDVENNTTTF